MIRQLALSVLLASLLVGAVAHDAVSGETTRTTLARSESYLRLAAAADSGGDRVFLTDGSSVLCSVIRVTDSHVEIDPDGPKPFQILERSDVKLIVYADNTVVDLSKPEADPKDASPAKPASTAAPEIRTEARGTSTTYAEDISPSTWTESQRWIWYGLIALCTWVLISSSGG